MQKRQNFLLVIGIDKYHSASWPNLNNAVRDAKDIITLLTEKYGFELLDEPLFDKSATRENISQLFANAVTQLMDDDNLIIYFAGHGFMNPMTSKGFWVPHEADLKPTEMISNSEIKDFIEVLPAKHILLLADSCFSGTFISRTRGRLNPEPYSVMDSKKSGWVLTSGHEETVSDGVAGESSPFARYLKRFLTENTNAFASVAELVKYVCAMTASVSKQTPQGAPISNLGHEDGQLILSLKPDLRATNIEESDGNPVTAILRDELRAVYRGKINYSGGKEVALLDMTGDPNTLILIENFRFDDNGNKKLIFKDGMVEMATKDEPATFPVFARAATMEGMHRYLEENKPKFEKIKIMLWPAHESIGEVESTPFAISQREFIQDMIDQNVKVLQCLHCGKMISTNDSFTVEIDEEGLNPNAGNVHKECLRSVDRMIGRATLPEVEASNLINFDYLKWIELLKTGQGFISGALRTAENHSGAVISWNKTHHKNAGEYCMKTIFADGTSDYMKIGKDIHRLSAEEIDSEVEKMNKESGVFGKLSKTGTFGDVDYLENIKLTGEEVIPIVEYVKVRYSIQLATKATGLANDYAPLGLLLGAGDKILLFGNIVPIVSDPFMFDELYDNWKTCGFINEPCTLQILENDKEVDFYLMDFFSDNLIPVLNPKFTPEQALLSGLSIMDMQDVIAMKDVFNSGDKKSSQD